MIDNRFHDAQVFTDIQGLGKLKYQAKVDEAGTLKEAAKQFESVFLNMVLKSMRDASAVFEEGNFLHSNQSRFYRDMFDQQLALHLSQGNGIGLADALVKQMARYVDDESKSDSLATVHSAETNATAIKERASAQYEGGAANALNDVLQNFKPQALANVGDEIAHIQETFNDPDEFIDAMLPHAREAAKELGVDARVLVAQAALETGWGKHVMQAADGKSSFNLFGIKADSRWSGSSVNKSTLEFKDGVPEKQVASFRSYDSYKESFSDYVAFIKSNARYNSALAEADNPKAYTQELQKAGYATDPKYSEKISGIFDRYFDEGASHERNSTKQI